MYSKIKKKCYHTLMKIKYSTKDLFSHLSFFGNLSEKTKLSIFKVSCRNNFRYLHLPNPNQQQVLRNILESNRLQNIVLFEEIFGKINNKLNHVSLRSNNYLKKLLEIEGILQSSQLNKWESSVILNIWLARNNFCPFLRFAFNQWHDISQKNNHSSIPSLVEFSTVYLYRLAQINKHVNVHGIHLADGSHNSLFLIKKTKQIKKIPRSIAAEYFINDYEVKITKLLFKSSLKKYIPDILSYDKATKIITRQYITGKTGHELLVTNFFDKNTKAIKDLKRFFNLYRKVARKHRINLDIHPGNFIWSKEKQQWFLVDTGPIPSIGSNYFPLNSFRSYFQKIWIERHLRIKKLPIRSVDLGF